MKDPLATYVHDHLAGATGAIELLEALVDRHSTDSLGHFSRDLLVEVTKDKVVLEQLAAQLNAGSNVLKEAASWLSEKATRLKLHHQTEGALGTFESLEALTLGIIGKEALWTALSQRSSRDVRLQGLDYPTLLARARAQYGLAESQRIEHVHTAFNPPIQ